MKGPWCCRSDRRAFSVPVVVPVTLPHPSRIKRPGQLRIVRLIPRLEGTRNLSWIQDLRRPVHGAYAVSQRPEEVVSRRKDGWLRVQGRSRRVQSDRLRDAVSLRTTRLVKTTPSPTTQPTSATPSKSSSSCDLNPRKLPSASSSSTRSNSLRSTSRWNPHNQVRRVTNRNRQVSNIK